jgi:hypothetical protein
MIGVTKILSTSVDSLKRRVLKVLLNGRVENGTGDVRQPLQSASFGVDSNPTEDKVGIYARSQTNGKYYIIGVINTASLAEVGETRLFSTDANGQLKFNIWLKNNGEGLIGTSDEPADYTNFAVRFNELKQEFNKLKADHNELVSKWNAFCGSYVPGGPTLVGTPPTLASSTVSANTSDIDQAKNSKVKFCD